ncbi:MAG TPA: hypothetical protein VFV71_00955 [Burkholderiales bacterium]|nr:hypothetical protein [Burkholderiales bacterium]
MNARTGVRQDPLQLGLALLRGDAQYRFIAPERRGVLVEAALRDGRELAAEAALRHGRLPEDMVSSLGIAVEAVDAEAGYGSVVVYAHYVQRPPRITLYLPAIARLAHAVSAGDVPTGVDEGTLRRMFVAHELYHHFDCLRSEPLARRHRVKLFGLGAWRWTSGLASLAEIAAGAFAQELLGLAFHPGLLDCLFRQQIGNHGGHGVHGGKQE